MRVRVIIDRAMFIDHVYHTPIGQEWNRQPGGLLQRAVPVGECRQVGTGVCQKCQSFLRTFALGNCNAELLSLLDGRFNRSQPVPLGCMKLFTQPANSYCNGSKYRKSKPIFGLLNIKRTDRLQNCVSEYDRTEHGRVARGPKTAPPRQKENHREERNEWKMLPHDGRYQPARAPCRHHADNRADQSPDLSWFFPHFDSRSRRFCRAHPTKNHYHTGR